MMAGDHKFQLIFVWIPGVKEIYFSFPFQIFFKTVDSLLKHLFISAHPQIIHFGGVVSGTFDSHHYAEKMVLFH